MRCLPKRRRRVLPRQGSITDYEREFDVVNCRTRPVPLRLANLLLVEMNRDPDICPPALEGSRFSTGRACQLRCGVGRRWLVFFCSSATSPHRLADPPAHGVDPIVQHLSSAEAVEVYYANLRLC
jgi:hypothetical protein